MSFLALKSKVRALNYGIAWKVSLCITFDRISYDIQTHSKLILKCY